MKNFFIFTSFLFLFFLFLIRHRGSPLATLRTYRAAHG